jgi:hypothetical protein
MPAHDLTAAEALPSTVSTNWMLKAASTAIKELPTFSARRIGFSSHL